MVAQNGQSEAPGTLTEAYNVPGLPVLSPNGKRFVAAYISSNFNLEAACKAANLRPEQANLYTTDAGIQAHIEAHFRFMHTALKCVAAGTRQIVLAELTQRLATCTDPKDRDILITRLQRATAASLIPAGTTRSGHGTPADSARSSTSPRLEDQSPIDKDPRSEISEVQDPGSNPAPPPSAPSPSFKSEISSSASASVPSVCSVVNADSEFETPRLSVTFRPTDSPNETAHKLFTALSDKDSPDPDSDLAAVADLIEFDAEINGEPVERDDPEETIEAIGHSAIADLRAITSVHHLQSIAHADHAATEVWSVGTPRGNITRVTLDFTKAPPTDSLSRAPGRWLLRKLTIAPGPKTFPPDKPPARESG